MAGALQFGRVTAATSAELWNSGSTTLATDHASFQSDGNFVLLDASSASLWNSGISGHLGSQLALQTSGSLTITDMNGTVVWHT